MCVCHSHLRVFVPFTATAPLVPFLPTYAKQLGFSSVIVGTIYMVLPVAGMLAKPLFGAVADRFRLQKTLFLVFQMVTLATFFVIQFVPEIPTQSAVQLDCGAESIMRICSTVTADQCFARKLALEKRHLGDFHCKVCVLEYLSFKFITESEFDNGLTL